MRYVHVFSMAGVALLAAIGSARYLGADRIGRPADLSDLLEPIRKQHSLPAVAGAILADGKLEAIGAVGVRKFGDPTPVTVDDRFHLGSCTKAMTATLIGVLVERGKLKWTTTLAEGFPDLAATMRPEYKGVTLEMLLCQRSGFPASGIPKGKSNWDLHLLPGTPMEQRRAYLGMFLKDAPEAPPGSKFIYSNANFAIAGAMAETVMKKPYEELLQDLVFKPLGITTAGFGAMGTPGNVEQPWQHVLSDGKPKPIEPGKFSDNPPTITPAGRVHMSLGDWAKFVAAHVDGERKGGLLKRETFRKLHTPLAGGDYAFGWVVMERPWGGGKVLFHNGSNTMNYAVVWAAPLRGFAVMAATNLGGGDTDKACDEVCAALIGRHLQSAKQQPGSK